MPLALNRPWLVAQRAAVTNIQILLLASCTSGKLNIQSIPYSFPLPLPGSFTVDICFQKIDGIVSSPEFPIVVSRSSSTMLSAVRRGHPVWPHKRRNVNAGNTQNMTFAIRVSRRERKEHKIKAAP